MAGFLEIEQAGGTKVPAGLFSWLAWWKEREQEFEYEHEQRNIETRALGRLAGICCHGRMSSTAICPVCRPSITTGTR
jgi:hypothetical protein